MITLDDIKLLVAAGESETLEFKKSTGQRTEACRTLCAMANGKGGKVIFGIAPENHSVVGQTVSQKTLDDLAAEFRKFEPALIPTIERVPFLADKELLVVSVLRATRPPCTWDGRAYQRIASATSPMPRDQYQNLLLEGLHGTERWENTVARGWTVDKLDVREMILTLEEAIRRGRIDDPQTRDPLAVLRGLKLLSPDGELLRAAVVLFGKEDGLSPEYTQCALRVARFRGMTKDEFLDNRRFEGNAFTLLRRAERFLIESLPIAGRIIPGVIEREDSPLYPLEALREALANAFCHRDYALGGGSVSVGIYDDRLEITSSGDLHFGLDVEKLFQSHDSLPWNPLIAQTFYKRGIIESWGRGIAKIVKLTEAAGLIRPTITATGGAVTVTFYPERYLAPQLSSHSLTTRQRLIMQILGENGKNHLIVSEIAKIANQPEALRGFRKDLYFLKDLGLVQFSGVGRGARWTLSERKNQT
jgi:ATP-dependent DNA helicase RecG